MRRSPARTVSTSPNCPPTGAHDQTSINCSSSTNRFSGLSPDKNAELTQAYRQSGMRGYWLKDIQQMKEGANPANMSPFWIAADYAMLGENDQAFEWLERAYNWASHEAAGQQCGERECARRDYFGDFLHRFSFYTGVRCLDWFVVVFVSSADSIRSPRLNLRT